jgi:hypothetical protein
MTLNQNLSIHHINDRHRRPLDITDRSTRTIDTMNLLSGKIRDKRLLHKQRTNTGLQEKGYLIIMTQQIEFDSKTQKKLRGKRP